MYILSLFLFLSFQVNAQELSFRTQWTCPTEARGDLPERKEIRVDYTSSGEIRFRPDIFANRPLSIFTRLFRGRRSGQGLSECVRGFFDNLEAPLAVLRQTTCSLPARDTLCTRNNEQIRFDIAREIRSSAFARKYAQDLASASETLNPPPPVATAVVTPPVTPGPAAVSPVAPETAAIRDLRGSEDPRARARALDYLMDNYDTLRSDDYRAFQRLCPRLGETPGANARYCDDRYRRYGRVISNATQLLAPLKGTNLEEADVATALACLPPQNEFRDISDILNSLQDSCGPIAVGSSRRFPNRTTPGHSYHMKRTGDSSYEATVVVNFNQISGIVSGPQMITRSNECFTAMAPYLKTPSGEQLRIRYVTPEQARTQFNAFDRPPAVDISIETAGTDPLAELRGHSRAYTDAFRCETIIHETLHHLGLCDEYPEMDDRNPLNADGTRKKDAEGVNELSMQDAWSCRFVPRTNTVMNIHSTAIAQTLPLAFSCRCKEGAVGEACRRSMSARTTESELVRRLLIQPLAQSVFGSSVMNKCTPLNSPNTASYRATRIENRVRLIGNDPESFILSEAVMGASQFGLFPVETFKRCSCQGDASCTEGVRRGIAHLEGRNPVSMIHCPWEMEPTPPGDPLFHFQNGAGLAAPGETASFSADGFRAITTPSVTSQALLAPNHLSRIVYGGCETGPAASYNQCQQFAQRARADQNPEYCAAHPDRCCTSRPEQCNSDQHYLGIGGSAGSPQ